MTETWMPVSGTFRTYPLSVERSDGWDDPAYWAKGHHDPAEFLLAAQLIWLDYDGDRNVIYFDDDNTWLEVNPIWVPEFLRDPARVRHEWWANRQTTESRWEGWRYQIEPVEPTARGAYPVTVIWL